MPAFFTEPELRVIAAACDRLIPPDDEGAPGAAAAGVADYIDTLLGAFMFDPPRIFAGGPFSGRHGGPANFDKLAQALAPYVAVARKDASSSRRAASPALKTKGLSAAEQRAKNQRVRDWAKSQKMKVSERGRVPAKLSEAYHAAGLR